MKTNMISMWRGKPVADLTREELIEALEWCGKELQERNEETLRWMRAADPLKYLMQQPVNGSATTSRDDHE